MTAEVIDTSRVVCFLEPMQGTKLRSVRAGGDERMPWDALVGQVAADRIGYAGEEFCSRSPPNFFPAFPGRLPLVGSSGRLLV